MVRTATDADDRESESRFRLLVEHVKDYGIFILSPEGYVETWNAGAQRLKGYTAAEIIGLHFSVFYPPAEVAAGKCEIELEGACRDGRFEDEGWRVRKDGTRFWANVVITALREDGGRLIGFAKVTRDLTERRAAEEEARRFRLLVESVKDYGIFILSPEGRIETWNAGAERLKGYTAPEIIGQHFSVFYPPADVAAGKCEMELEGASRDGRFEDEGWRVRKDGGLFWANVVITALRNEAGALIGFAKVTRDLTERKQAEQTARALAAERAMLAEKSRIQEFQERFLAILGHDLRNPLAAIGMGASLLRAHGAQDAASLRVLGRIEASAGRMSRMIEQILDLTRSRLAAGLEIKRTATELGSILRPVVDELQTAHPARVVDLQCPSISGMWDGDRLEQLFSNLVGNAIHYGSPEHPVTVRARSEGGSVVVNVHNHGVPIPEELRVKIFDPFRRGTRDSRSSTTEGLGLGLYISREIAVAHGGEIEVSSTQPEGTHFTVRLPLSSSPEVTTP
jgi:PAS domain S-box-containing protein